MHGFRVAQRIADLIGAHRLGEFSTSELALLLAAAYLHDIGMTPERGHVQRHRGYLLSGEASLLSGEERDQLQMWLDDHADGLVPPLSSGAPDSATLARADELLTYYCRSRHNDWSADWIREHVAGGDRELYFGFSDDLIQLCRSHHEGYDELIASRFDAKLIGAEIVHPRYLAALLRIGDILEFDPERTPEIIFRHRDVAPSSTIYWHKDHEVSFRTEQNYFIFYARPRDAATYQALRQMANEIDFELAVCARLAKEGRFQLAPLRSGNDPRYEWRFEPGLKRDLHPKAGAFEEFEGAFQPNPRRLLSLLAGTQLYDTPLAAVRELLQNAFDAVREQIAYERLAELERFGAADPATVAARHFVTLDIRADGDRWELVCTDSGVGMTRDILRRRFLTSGSGRGHRELDLERRCRSHGFGVGRTGEFGIGALSYFILADRIRLTTHRSAEPGDFDGAWQFSVGGLNDFGELRRAEGTKPGTVVTLRLRPEMLPDGIDEFKERVERYLAGTVRRVPCRFLFRDGSGSAVIAATAGWTRTAEDLARAVFHPFLQASEETIPRVRREEALKSLRWDVEEGELPNGLGIYRLHMFWFDLNGVRSRGWFALRPDSTTEFRGQGVAAHSVGFTSWHGMAVSPNYEFGSPGMSTEIDFASSAAGRITVNRAHFELAEQSDSALDFMEQRARAMDEEWLRRSVESPFWTHASCLTGRATEPRPAARWAFRRDTQDTYAILPIDFPVTVRSRGRARLLTGQPLDRLDAFPDTRGTEFFTGSASPTRIVVHENDRLDALFVWDHDGNVSPRIDAPPAWREIFLIESTFQLHFVNGSPLVASVAAELGEVWPRLTVFSREAVFAATNDARLRLLLLLGGTENEETWGRLEPELHRQWWDEAMAKLDVPLPRLIHLDVGNDFVWIYSRDGTVALPFDEIRPEQLGDLLPDPGPEWQFERY